MTLLNLQQTPALPMKISKYPASGASRRNLRYSCMIDQAAGDNLGRTKIGAEIGRDVPEVRALAGQRRAIPSEALRGGFTCARSCRGEPAGPGHATLGRASRYTRRAAPESSWPARHRHLRTRAAYHPALRCRADLARHPGRRRRFAGLRRTARGSPVQSREIWRVSTRAMGDQNVPGATQHVEQAQRKADAVPR